MKSMILLLLVTIFHVLSLYAGEQLEVCENLSKSGECRSAGSNYIWTGNKLVLNLLLYNTENIQPQKIFYKVYLLKEKDKKQLYAELSLYPLPNWKTAVKKIWFAMPGDFEVDVFSDAGDLLSSTNISIAEN